MKTSEEIKDKRHMIRVLRLLAKVNIAEENYETAEIQLKQARELREQETQLSAGLAEIYQLLGQISFLKQNYDLALPYFRRSLEIGQKINSPQIIAVIKQRIAELELALGNTEQAKILTQEAIEIFTKLGMKRELRETQALLTRITAEAE